MAERIEQRVFLGSTQFGLLEAIDRGEIGRMDAADEFVLAPPFDSDAVVRDPATVQAAWQEMGIVRILPGADWQQVRKFCARLADYWTGERMRRHMGLVTDQCRPDEVFLENLLAEQAGAGVELNPVRLQQPCAEVDFVMLLQAFWKASPDERPALLEDVRRRRQTFDPALQPVLVGAIRQQLEVWQSRWQQRQHDAAVFCCAAGIPYSPAEQFLGALIHHIAPEELTPALVWREWQAFESELRTCQPDVQLEERVVYREFVRRTLDLKMGELSRYFRLDDLDNFFDTLQRFAIAAGIGDEFSAELRAACERHRTRLLDSVARSLGDEVVDTDFADDTDDAQKPDALTIPRDRLLQQVAGWGLSIGAADRAQLDRSTAEWALEAVANQVTQRADEDGLTAKVAGSLVQGLTNVERFAERAGFAGDPAWQARYAQAATAIPQRVLALDIARRVDPGRSAMMSGADAALAWAARYRIVVRPQAVHAAALLGTLPHLKRAAERSDVNLVTLCRKLADYARATGQIVPVQITEFLGPRSEQLRDEIISGVQERVEELDGVPETGRGYLMAQTYLRETLGDLREPLRLTELTEETIWAEVRSAYAGERGLEVASQSAGLLLLHDGMDAMRNFVVRFRRTLVADLRVARVFRPDAVFRAALARCLDPSPRVSSRDTYRGVEHIGVLAKDLIALAAELKIDLRRTPDGEAFLRFAADRQLDRAQELGRDGIDAETFERMLDTAADFAARAGHPFAPAKLSQMRQDGLRAGWIYARERIAGILRSQVRHRGALLTARTYIRGGEFSLKRLAQCDPSAIPPLRAELQALSAQVEAALRDLPR